MSQRPSLARSEQASLNSTRPGINGYNNNFTVAVRVKPQSQSSQSGLSYHSPTPQTLIVTHPQAQVSAYSAHNPKKYAFDHIFIQKSNLQIYYEVLQPRLGVLADNYNLTVLTYGITGSGKTHTTFGSRELGEVGIAMLCISDVMGRFQGQFSLSYMQIYNEQIQDLLQDSGRSKNLSVMQDANGKLNIPELTRIPVSTVKQVEELIEMGNTARSVSSNNINKASSRSHALLQLYFVDKNTRIENTVTIIDLAGSERHSHIADRRKSQDKENKSLHKQGSNINKSLLALGSCLKGLENRQNHIPYRDSKLTRILKDDLSGKAHNIMIACVSGNYGQAEQTINTLNYASRAARIRVHRTRNTLGLDGFQCEHCFKLTPFSQVLQRIPHSLLDIGRSNSHIQFNASEGLLQNIRTTIDQQLTRLKSELFEFVTAQLERPDQICSFRTLFGTQADKQASQQASNIGSGISTIVDQCQQAIFEDIGYTQFNNQCQKKHTLNMRSRSISQKPRRSAMHKQQQLLGDTGLQKIEQLFSKTMKLDNLISGDPTQTFREPCASQKSNLRKKIPLRNHKYNLHSALTANTTALCDLSNISSSFQQPRPQLTSKTRRMNPDFDSDYGSAQDLSSKRVLIRKIQQAKKKCIDYSHQNMSVFELEEEANPTRRRDLSIKVNGGTGDDICVSSFMGDELDYCT